MEKLCIFLLVLIRLLAYTTCNFYFIGQPLCPLIVLQDICWLSSPAGLVQAIRTERQIEEKVKLCLRASGWRIIM
jgi:hypothetical protein